MFFIPGASAKLRGPKRQTGGNIMGVRWIRIALALVALTATSGARAESPDLSGTSYPAAYFARSFGCQELWFMRNSIYHEAGYCFETVRAIRTFGNQGCMTRNPRFNRHQRANIAAISTAEAARGCSR
jgi:hypothetical protein